MRAIRKLFNCAAVSASCLLSTFLPAGAQQSFEKFPDKPITFIAQAAAGSGFDQTVRAITATLDKEGLVKVGMPVVNMQSASVGAQTIATRHANNPYMMSVGSVAGMVRYATGASPYRHTDFTPIARLISDYYVIVVRADSPLQNMQQFLAALKANPRAFPLTGGQSDDRVFYGLVFSEAGIDPTQVNYVAFSGGGEASALLLEGSARAQFSSLSDVAGLLVSKEIRALGFSGSKRLSGELAHVPTLIEQGINIEWQNFRYAMGGPNMPAPVVAYWKETLAKMVKTKTWQDELARHRWNDEFLIEGFSAYLDETQAKIIDVTKRLGMAK